MTAPVPPADSALRDELAEAMSEAAGAIWHLLGSPTKDRFRAQADAALTVLAAHLGQQQAAIERVRALAEELELTGFQRSAWPDKYDQGGGDAAIVAAARIRAALGADL